MKDQFTAWCAVCLDKPAAVFINGIPYCNQCEHSRRNNRNKVPTANILEAFKCP